MASSVRRTDSGGTPRYLSVDEYLALEATAAVRHEYVGGERFALAGGSPEHSFICSSVAAAFHEAALGSGCVVGNRDLLVRVDTDLFYYPDLSTICDPEGYTARFATRPCAVVEVLSPSTAATDQREKRMGYRRNPALRAYLIVHQDRVLVEAYYRDDDGGWQVRELVRGDYVTLPCPVARVPVEAFYRQVPHLLQ